MTARTRDLRGLVIGGDEVVAALGGAMVRYVNLDNAATTPPLRAAVDAVEDLRQCPPRERAQITTVHRGLRTGPTDSRRLPRRRPRTRHRRVHEEHVVPAPTIAVGKEVGIRHPSLRAQRVIN